MARVPSVLAEMWPIIAWLDRARWHAGENPIPGPVFERLPPAEQVLTHWLCCVLDAQRSFAEVWTKGGPMFAEMVEEYAAARRPALTTLRQFSHDPEQEDAKLDLLSSRRQHDEEGAIGLARGIPCTSSRSPRRSSPSPAIAAA